MPDDVLRDMISVSYVLVLEGLPRKVRHEIAEGGSGHSCKRGQALTTTTPHRPLTAPKSSSWLTTGMRWRAAVAAIQRLVHVIRRLASAKETRSSAGSGRRRRSTGRISTSLRTSRVAIRRARVSVSRAARTPRLQLGRVTHRAGTLGRAP